MHSIRRLISLGKRSPFSNAFRRVALSTEATQGESQATISIESLQKQLAEKDEKLRELKDSYLLSLADMENLRQRTKRDIESASLFAIQRFSKDIISVADVLEMALASAKHPTQPATTGETEDASASPSPSPSAHTQLKDLLDGLSMTMTEMHKVFNKHGISVIDPLHQKFDPNLHNALYEMPSAEVDAGTIVSVQKKGFLLHGRVLRPADVGVARKP